MTRFITDKLPSVLSVPGTRLPWISAYLLPVLCSVMYSCVSFPWDFSLCLDSSSTPLYRTENHRTSPFLTGCFYVICPCYCNSVFPSLPRLIPFPLFTRSFSFDVNVSGTPPFSWTTRVPVFRPVCVESYVLPRNLLCVSRNTFEYCHSQKDRTKDERKERKEEGIDRHRSTFQENRVVMLGQFLQDTPLISGTRLPLPLDLHIEWPTEGTESPTTRNSDRSDRTLEES